MIKTEYTILESLDSQKLIYEVNKHIDDSWEVVGGVTMHINSTNSFRVYAQAMIKYAKVN